MRDENDDDNKSGMIMKDDDDDDSKSGYLFDVGAGEPWQLRH